MMRELALFAGGGGGILGGALLGWRPVCAVEYAPFCRDILLARQRDGILPRFPIWDDVKTFDGKPWKGQVDVVSGGFPCQPFSSAARGRNVAENLWPEMLRVIGEVQPKHVFAENVAREPIAQAAGDLSRLGYGVSIAEISAASMGAPHIRPRWWLRGDSDREGESMGPQHGQVGWVPPALGGLWGRPKGASFRVPDGMANRMDRARALGNGQVPAVAALAWRTLGPCC